MSYRAKQRSIVALVAVAGVAAAMLLVVFGMPYGRSTPEAFAHLYTHPNGNTTHLHIDADITNGSRPCEPLDDVQVVEVGSTHEVGVCIESYDISGTPTTGGGGTGSVESFELHIQYSGDPGVPDNINAATEIDPGVPPYLDDNPDANAGDDVTGYKLGGGWDCTGLGIQPPVGDDTATASVFDAVIICNASVTAPDKDLIADPGLLATIEFTAVGAGTDVIDFGPIDAANKNAVGKPRPGAGIARCGTAVPADQVGCFGATIVKAPPPDIEVIKDCPDQVLVSTDFQCYVTVHNAGNGMALSVDLLEGEIPNPSLSLDYLSYTVLPYDPGCIFLPGLGGGLMCPLGLMLPSDMFTIIVDIHAAGPEGINVNAVQADVTSGLPDADPTNNTALEQIHEFQPDIVVNKTDSTVGPNPGQGWNFDLYAGACPPTGLVIDTGVSDAAGQVIFPNVGNAASLPADFCVEETQKVGYGSNVPGPLNDPDPEITVNVDGTLKEVDVDFDNSLLVADEAKDLGVAASAGSINLPVGVSTTVNVTEVIEVINPGAVPNLIHIWDADTGPGVVKVDWDQASPAVDNGNVAAAPAPSDPNGDVPTNDDQMGFSTENHVAGIANVSADLTVECVSAGAETINLSLDFIAANAINTPSLGAIEVNCSEGGLVKRSEGDVFIAPFGPSLENLFLCAGMFDLDGDGIRDADDDADGIVNEDPVGDANGDGNDDDDFDGLVDEDGPNHALPGGQCPVWPEEETIVGLGGADTVGAFEFQIKFDHKLLDIVVRPTDWLASTGRDVNCEMTIISENDIRFACASTGDVPGPVANDGDVIAQIWAMPEGDLINRLTPGQENGVVADKLDENCEMATEMGDPIDGSLPGGLLAVCGDGRLTIRILEADLNLDCRVDVLDDQMIAFRYGAAFGNLLYDPWYDLEPALKDFDIDIKDLQKVFGRNGSVCAAPIPPQPPQ